MVQVEKEYKRTVVLSSGEHKTYTFKMKYDKKRVGPAITPEIKAEILNKWNSNMRLKSSLAQEYGISMYNLNKILYE